MALVVPGIQDKLKKSKVGDWGETLKGITQKSRGI